LEEVFTKIPNYFPKNTKKESNFLLIRLEVLHHGGKFEGEDHRKDSPGAIYLICGSLNAMGTFVRGVPGEADILI
jgi:hypothetical protein